MSTTTSTTPEPRDASGSPADTPPADTPPGGTPPGDTRTGTDRFAKRVAPDAAPEPVATTAPEPSAGSGWWALLLLGVLTVFYGLLVMSLRPAALLTIAVFAGVGFIVAGVAQFLIAGAIDGGWRWVAYAGGALGVVAGLAAFFWPGLTLLVLAVITAWAFVVNGLTRIVGTLLGAKEGLWWLGLVLGLFELLLGLWAIGSPVREALLFVNLIGIFLVVAGVDAIVAAVAGRTARAGTGTP